MQFGLTEKEASQIMLEALKEPLGILLYTSDRKIATQTLYKARRSDPLFDQVHIKNRPEGIVIWHGRTRGKLW